MAKRRIILASRSPRRKQLLGQIGLKFEVRESQYQEEPGVRRDPVALVKYLALRKAEDVARHYRQAIIIGADTLVVADKKIIGKPSNKKQAAEILKNLSGKEHKVVCGFAVIDTKNNLVINDFNQARVRFKNLTDQEIKDYIATGEPMDKAGAYGLMNQAAVFIEKVSGDFYSVVGLPLNKVYRALTKLGVKVLDRG